MLFANDKSGKIYGVIRDQYNQPIAGASITLNPDKIYTQSDKNGQFIIKSLYKGTYELNVSLLGYENHTQKVEVTNSQPTEINIKLFTGQMELNEVSVSSKVNAPDNLLNIERGAMPVTVIDRRTIELLGSRRLDEVLKEQTGLAIVNNIKGGSRSVGLQMQGFGSEYIMVLIDGQPMSGRNDGNFDLSRISVSNIERIEIIKGASSCLFGSDALGGAINIVTKHGAIEPQAYAALKYGSLNIMDATLEGETPFASQRGSINISANYYHTDGFNTDPKYISGVTAPPYNNYNIQGRARYQTGKSAFASISGRYALRRSFMNKDFGLNNTTEDKQDEQDLNLSANFNKTFKNRIQSLSRYYYTHYQNDNQVEWKTGGIAGEDVFIQNFNRFEQQINYAFNNQLKLVGGFGGSIESMSNKTFSTDPSNVFSGFTYTQADWTINKKFGIVGGLRYDHHNSYGGRLNPSLGLQYQISPKVNLKLAAGSGFKAPDFKNRYLVFYNPLANYRVIGTEVLQETLDDLQNAGQISEIREYLVKQLDKNLKAEKSNSINLGLGYKPAEKLKIEAGIFYHKIYDQINAVQVATSINNGHIYTYQNLPEVVNKGGEFSFSINPFKNVEVNFGYQYLISKDLSVLEKIKNGEYPYNKIRDNETGETKTSKPSDYWGIENRSRHMFNFKTLYYWPEMGVTTNFRINYRGKYPFADTNNNQFIDKYDHFVDGYFLFNLSVEKKIQEKLSIQITADNLLDYYHRDIPGQPGRIILAGISYRFFKN
ncbi:TonB-dependent receptor [Pseudopedobacter beijingensis]|uniref:TonB-dependent receptor domain-containing protein n=1 Tax=Pseudopedobacter beijingensis TaxID=1207056 RepID=A0ABW4IGN8_9SPHI